MIPSYLRIFCSWQHFWCSIIFVGPVTDIEDDLKKKHASLLSFVSSSQFSGLFVLLSYVGS